MTRIAFYAPMKPPTHPTPSGDRTMGRNLLHALRAGGATVQLASEMRVYDPIGDTTHQTTLQQQAKAEAQRLITQGKDAGWQLWLTYHNYYKAPDLLGPSVSAALGIPYFLVEATRARKRLNGPWAAFATAAEQACDAATAIFYLTEQDAEALRDRAPAGQDLHRLRPFLPIETLPPASTRSGPMLSVGMLRRGDKLDSYALIAQALGRVQTSDWRLDIAGDGNARTEVEKLMHPFGPRVSFRGEVNAATLQELYSTARLLLWPGVNEAFGLVYLEAQAAGVPVIAQDRPGVRDVLAPGIYANVSDGPAGLSRRIDHLLTDEDAAQAAAQTARDHVQAHHLIDGAKQTLFSAIEKVI